MYAMHSAAAYSESRHQHDLESMAVLTEVRSIIVVNAYGYGLQRGCLECLGVGDEANDGTRGTRWYTDRLLIPSDGRTDRMLSIQMTVLWVLWVHSDSRTNLCMYK